MLTSFADWRVLPVSASQSDRHRSIERDVIASTRFAPKAGRRCAFIAEL